MKTKTDSVAYAIGVTIGSNMKKDGLDSLNLDILSKALKSSIKGDSMQLSAQQSQSVIQSYLTDKQKQKAERLKVDVARRVIDKSDRAIMDILVAQEARKEGDANDEVA